MKKYLLSFGFLLSSPAFSLHASFADWKAEVIGILNGPDGEGRYVKVCVLDDCVVSNRFLRFDPLNGGPPEINRPWNDTDFGMEGAGGNISGAGGGASGGGAAPASASPALDRVVDRLTKMGSANAEITIHYEEKTVAKDGTSKEMKVDVTIKGGVGGAASGPAPKQE